MGKEACLQAAETLPSVWQQQEPRELRFGEEEVLSLSFHEDKEQERAMDPERTGAGGGLKVLKDLGQGQSRKDSCLCLWEW